MASVSLGMRAVIQHRTVHLVGSTRNYWADTTGKVTGADALVAALVKSDVRHVFGIPGTHTVPLYRALQRRQDDITHITTRHEQGAGYAAEGYGRATGKIAAACVITGCGLTNVLTSMGSALADAVPMLVISSDVPKYWRDRPQRQFSHFIPNVNNMAAAVAKYAVTVENVEDIEAAVNHACEVALSGRPGPVSVTVPINLFQVLAELNVEPLPERKVPELSAADATNLAQAAAMLWKSKNPLVVVGGGAKDACGPFLELVEALGAPVLHTVGGKGVLDERHRLSCGGRMHHRAACNTLFDQADSLLLLGTQLSPTDWWKFDPVGDVPLPFERLGPNTLHVDIDVNTLKQCGIAEAGGVIVQADASVACRAILDTFQGLDAVQKWGGDAEVAVKTLKAAADAPDAMSRNMLWDFSTPGSGGQEQMAAIEVIRKHMPDHAPLVGDVCRISYTAISAFTSYSSRKFIYPVGTTCLGYGFPAAIGAAVGTPGTCVPAIIGDGGFQFTFNELAVAVEQELPILSVIWNDEAYGEIKRNLPDFATELKVSPDLGKLCESYGCPFIRVTDAAGLEAALLSDVCQPTLQGRGGPVVIEIFREWDPIWNDSAAK